jgi:hypothetical protein
MQLVHDGLFPGKKAVNKPERWMVDGLDFIASSVLLTRFSQGRTGEQAVYINSLLDSKNLIVCSQFIERTKRAVESKINIVRFQDNPG